MVFNLGFFVLSLIFALLLFRTSFTSRKKIIGVTHTDVRLFLVNLTFYSLCLAILLNSISALILSFALEYKLRFSIFAVLYFFPILTIFHIINKTPHMIDKLVKSNQKPSSDLSGLVRELCNKIGLDNSPKVLVSDKENHSPYTLGCLPKKTFLVFPANFSEMISTFVSETIDDNKKIQKTHNSLRNFIILHELSHIKNKDVFFITYYLLNEELFRRTTLLWAISVMFANWTIPAVNISKSILIPPQLIILNAGLFYLMLQKTLKAREFLADACALLYISKEEEENLFSKIKKTGTSIFYLFCGYLEGLPELRANQNGLKLYSRIDENVHTKTKNKLLIIKDKIFNYFSDKSPTREERFQAILDRRFLKTGELYPDWDSLMWLGISNPLVLTTFIYIGIATKQFIFTVNSFYQNIPFSASSSAKDSNLFVSICGLMFCAFFTSTALNIPLRNSYSPVKKYLRFSTVIQIIRRLFYFSSIAFLTSIILLIFSGFYLVITPRNFLILFNFNLLLTLVFYGVSLSYQSHIHLITIPFSQTGEMENQGHMGDLFVIFTSLALLFSATIIFLKLINLWFPHIYVLFTIFGFGFMITQMRSNPRMLVFSLKKKYIVANIIKTKVSIDLLEHDTLEAIFVVLKICTLVLLFYLIIPIFIPYVLFCSFLFLLDPILISMFDKVSFALLLNVLIYAFAISIFMKASSSFFVKSDRERLNPVMYFYPIFKLCSLINYQIEADIYKNVLSKISEFWTSEGGYTPREIDKTVSFFITLRTVELIEKHDDEKSQHIFDYLQNFYNRTGGYSVLEGGAPRLQETYYALSIIEHIGKVENLNKNSIIRWIKSCQDSSTGLFRTPKTRLNIIMETFCAIQSLKILNAKLPSKEESLASIRKLWLKEPTITNTYYYLNCLMLTKNLKNEDKTEIIEQCINNYEPTLKNWKIEEAPHLIYEFAFIEKNVRRKNSKESIEFTHNIQEKIKIVFQDFENFKLGDGLFSRLRKYLF